MNNVPTQNKLKFSAVIATPTYQNLVNRTLGDPNRAKRFIAAITSAVAVNSALQECTPNTILAGALLGESLNLSPSPQLGQFYLVPFKNKKAGATDAQFILGYKGYIQLALRTGQYRRLNVVAVKEGELISYNAFTEELLCNWIENEEQRTALKTVGYAARFEYMNGFEKVIYWSKEKMLAHADRYSPAFSAAAAKKIENGEIPAGEMWKYSSFWYKDFDSMAMKTMLRQLIGKWGVMSSEIETAFDKDASVANISKSGEIFVEQTEEEPIIQQDEPLEPSQPPETAATISFDDL